MKRGTIKAFKNFLNQKYGLDTVGKGQAGGHIYKPTKRLYGDYLYSQDREMFMVLLNQTLQGIGDETDFQKGESL